MHKEVDFVRDELAHGLIKRLLETTLAGSIRNASVLVLVKKRVTSAPIA